MQVQQIIEYLHQQAIREFTFRPGDRLFTGIYTGQGATYAALLGDVVVPTGEITSAARTCLTRMLNQMMREGQLCTGNRNGAIHYLIPLHTRVERRER